MRTSLKLLRRNGPIAVALASGMLLAAGASVFATSIGTDITATGDVTITSGGRVGTGSTGTHVTALADDSLFVEGQAEFDGIVWFDASLRASSTLFVDGNVQFNNQATTTASSGRFETRGDLLASSTLVIDGNSTLASADIGGAYTAGSGSGATVSAAGALSINGNFALNGYATATASTGRFETQNSLLASSTLVIDGNGTLGDAGTDTLTVNAGATFNHATSTHMTVSSHASTSAITVGGGSRVAGIITGFCDFGPLTTGATVVTATTTNVACNVQSGVGWAAGDAVWLTASSTTGAPSVIYGGIASTTSATRIGAVMYNVTAQTVNVPTSTFRYLIIR